MTQCVRFWLTPKTNTWARKPSRSYANAPQRLIEKTKKYYTRVKEYSPTVRLAGENFVILAVWDYLKDNDPEGVIGILEAHMEAINKLQVPLILKRILTLPYVQLSSKQTQFF